MKWINATIVLAAFALVGFYYFPIRLGDEAFGGSAFVAAFATDPWLEILIFACLVCLALGIALSQSRLKRICILAAPLATLAMFLCFHSIEYDPTRGKVVTVWTPFFRHTVTPLPVSEGICIIPRRYSVTFYDTKSPNYRTVFRGIWPFSFSSRELEALGDLCDVR